MSIFTFTILVLLIAGSVAVYFYVRPLQVLSNKEWLISHGFIIAGLMFIFSWLWLNESLFIEVAILVAGIWTFSGGICFITAYVARKLKN